MRRISTIDNLLVYQNGCLYLAYTAFFSLLANYFVNVLDYSLSLTAILLLYSSLTFRISRVIFAPIIDRIQYQIALPLSLLLCSFGTLCLGLLHEPWLVALFILPIGIGFGVNNILIKYSISQLNDNNKATILKFTAISISTNLAAAIGPVIGSIFITIHSQFGIALFSASVFFIGFILALCITKQQIIHYKKQSWINCFKNCLFDLKFRQVFLLSMMCWFLYSQLISSLPLFLSKNLLLPEWVGVIFLVNAAVIVLCSVHFVKLNMNYTQDYNILIIIVLSLYMSAFLFLSIITNLYGMLIAIILMSLAESLFIPTLNAYITEITQEHERVACFTFNTLAIGIGEGTGMFIGARLIELGNKFYLVLCLLTFVFILFQLFHILRNKKNG